MRRQQEGFKGTFPDARKQEIGMGQMAMGGAVGINNRGAMPPAPAAVPLHKCLQPTVLSRTHACHSQACSGVPEAL